MDIRPIKAFSDNYIWAICNPNTKQVALVDPGDAQPALEFLQAHNMRLTAIILTHHHNDHIGGVSELLQHTKVPVYGPQSKFIPVVTNPVTDGAQIFLAEQDLHLNVMEIPGHTLDHIALYNDEMLFCGDTLFCGGCGRIFEGTPQQMLNAMQKLANLKPQTKVYCGHEYTQSNLKFALQVEPQNSSLQQRLIAVTALRNQGLPTVPSTMQEELATNPFLRTQIPAVSAAIAAHWHKQFKDQIEVFAALREWKNSI